MHPIFFSCCDPVSKFLFSSNAHVPPFERGTAADARTVLGDTLRDTGRALEKGAHAEASTVLGATLLLGDTRRALE